jgi:hypothetical protein
MQKRTKPNRRIAASGGANSRRQERQGRMAVQTIAAQTPKRRIALILRRVLRDQSDPKIRRFAQWGLKRYEYACSSEKAKGVIDGPK